MEKYIYKQLSFKPEDFFPGDIGLVRGRGGNIFEKFIRFGIRKFTNGVCNHAFIMSSKGKVIEATTSGVVKTSLKKYINNKDGILMFRYKNIKPHQLSLIMAAAEGRLGRRYDFKSVIAFLLRSLFHIEQKDDVYANFCSELIVESYAVAGIKTSDKPAYKTSPADLRRYFFKHKRAWKLIDWQNIGQTLADQIFS